MFGSGRLEARKVKELFGGGVESIQGFAMEVERVRCDRSKE